MATTLYTTNIRFVLSHRKFTVDKPLGLQPGVYQ